MFFTLETLQANHGDCLLLHYGEPNDPRLIVIDGGPGGIYPQHLRPRLEALRGAHQNRLRAAGEPEDKVSVTALPIRMVMVSHIDDDHINGVQGFLKDLKESGVRPFEIETLWHNSFDDLIGNEEGELGEASVAAIAAAFGGPGASGPGKGTSAAIVASVRQGRTVRNDAIALGLAINEGFDGLVTARGGQDNRADQGDGLEFLVTGPGRGRVEALQTEWNVQIKKLGIARTAEFLDDSIFNLASIVVLARANGRSMLLTGDARGDDILAGLEAANQLTGGRIHVDLLKVPHHGSDRNVSTEFFRQVTADHYVLSGDGKHGNPEIATLQMISEARGDSDFSLYLTNRRLKEGDPQRLDKFLAAEKAAGKNYRAVFPEEGQDSVRVDLGEPLQD